MKRLAASRSTSVYNMRRTLRSIKSAGQPSLPFQEAPFVCLANPLFSCVCKNSGVECAYKSTDGKAPPVALTTSEADNPNVVAHVEAGSLSIVQQPLGRKQEGIMEAREARGLEIAQSLDVRREGNVWIVPSQSKAKEYTVNLFLQTCTCPDFNSHRVKCKHI